jgi:integration host factor subunit beta
MTRSELVLVLAARFPQLTEEKADAVSTHILTALSRALRDGRRIEIRGFGSFSVNYRHPRLARNPITGVKVQVPGKSYLRFKPGKSLVVRHT